MSASDRGLFGAEEKLSRRARVYNAIIDRAPESSFHNAEYYKSFFEALAELYKIRDESVAVKELFKKCSYYVWTSGTLYDFYQQDAKERENASNLWWYKSNPNPYQGLQSWYHTLIFYIIDSAKDFNQAYHEVYESFRKLVHPQNLPVERVHFEDQHLPFMWVFYKPVMLKLLDKATTPKDIEILRLDVKVFDFLGMKKNDARVEEIRNELLAAIDRKEAGLEQAQAPQHGL